MQSLQYLLPAQPLLLRDEVPTHDSENSDRAEDNASLAALWTISWAGSGLVEWTYKIEVVVIHGEVERG